MAKHELSDVYRSERVELLDLGRSLTDAQAAEVTAACPAWSIKDIYAHLAGISTDILAGNTEDAATEAWADGHVADRQQRSFTEVLDEWQTAGQGVSEIMDEAGEFFPLELFVDQWTHGWDIRAALGAEAAARPKLDVFEYFLDEFFVRMAGRKPVKAAPLAVHIDDRTTVIGVADNDAAKMSLELEIDLFEFARISMGRRSLRQLETLPWPASITDRSPYIDALVFWSVNDADVIDPVIR